jgi:ankyrin repeat protein
LISRFSEAVREGGERDAESIVDGHVGREFVVASAQILHERVPFRDRSQRTDPFQPAAASALIEGGADPRLRNKSGSTPLHLAVQNTGKSNSGSEASKDEQGRVIAVLLGHGARPTDVDANGKSVAAAASSDWIRHVLDTP